MKRFKVNLMMVAMFVAVPAAFAFKAPTPPKNTSTWYRTSTFANRETSNVWVEGTAPSCLSATKICSASFEDGYDPNDHDLATNQLNAEGTITNGYVSN